jgi:hypothetical protein
MRFGDSVGFLTVSSVTAHVSFTTSATAQAGLGGPAANYSSPARRPRARRRG